MSLYRHLKPILFRFDPEQAHHFAMRASAAAGGIPAVRAFAQRRWGAPQDPRLVTGVAGITFPNPVGLGAGYDKSGEGIALMSRMGFGFLEIGSVSRWPSAGNPARPRVFRLPADEAVIVNYGVPNDGAEIVAERVTDARYIDPLMSGDGLDGVDALIAGVQQRFPDFRFQLIGQPNGFGDHLRF